MPVHDHFAEIMRRAEELFANPEQVFHPLLLQWNPRTHTSMGEEIIADFEPETEVFEEATMGAGEYAQEPLASVLECGIGVAQWRKYAVTQEGVDCPEFAPGAECGRLAEEVQQGLVVVAAQKMHVVAAGQIEKLFDDAF